MVPGFRSRSQHQSSRIEPKERDRRHASHPDAEFGPGSGYLGEGCRLQRQERIHLVVASLLSLSVLPHDLAFPESKAKRVLAGPPTVLQAASRDGMPSASERLLASQDKLQDPILGWVPFCQILPQKADVLAAN